MFAPWGGPNTGPRTKVSRCNHALRVGTRSSVDGSGEDIRSAKAALRGLLRARRRALGPSEIASGRACLATIVADPLLAARATVAGFVAHENEPDPEGLLRRLAMAGALVLLPRLGPDGIELVGVPGAMPPLVPGPFGLAEPTGPAQPPETAPLPALVLVPSVALAPDGARLGRGGGHYDRLLARLRPVGWTIVGVCHENEVQQALPIEAHDQPVDYILTEGGLRAARGTPGSDPVSAAHAEAQARRP